MSPICCWAPKHSSRGRAGGGGGQEGTESWNLSPTRSREPPEDTQGTAAGGQEPRCPLAHSLRAFSRWEVAAGSFSGSVARGQVAGRSPAGASANPTPRSVSGAPCRCETGSTVAIAPKALVLLTVPWNGASEPRRGNPG